MSTLIELAASIVESHASTTKMSSDDLLLEIQKVYNTLKSLESGESLAVPVEKEEQKPVLTIKQAFKQNEVICMICGKGGMKTLTRHLSQVHDMKPGEYRKQFGIPRTQPLASRQFSATRKKLAQEMNLAGNLAKARAVRMANIQAKKSEKPKKKSSRSIAETSA